MIIMEKRHTEKLLNISKKRYLKKESSTNETEAEFTTAVRTC